MAMIRCDMCEERDSNFMVTMHGTGDTMALCAWCMLPFSTELVAQLPDASDYLDDFLAAKVRERKAGRGGKAGKASQIPPPAEEPDDGEGEGGEGLVPVASETPHD